MKELVRVNSFMEAQDLRLFLGSEGIEAEIPDQHTLAIQGFASFGHGTGRIRVRGEDYDRALGLLKDWNTFYLSRETNPAQRFVEHPYVAGISPRQVVRGVTAWGELRFLGKVKVLGGAILMAFLGTFFLAWAAQWFGYYLI